MKTLISSLLAVAMLVSIPNMAMAGGKKKGDKGGDSGKVSAVDTTANTITISKKKSGESTTFKAAGAKITVDGVSAKLSDITVGMHAKVTVGSTPDTATAIDASKGGKGKGGKKGKNGNAGGAVPVPAASATPAPQS